MDSQDQLLLAGALGRAAYHAGKPCSPVGDPEFTAFVAACGGRQVGSPPAGEASALALLEAWISEWKSEEAARATSKC